MTIDRIDLTSSFASSSCVVAGDKIYGARHAGFERGW
jgi:hypothetical protein